MKTIRYFLFSIITLSIISNAQTIIPPGDVSGTWDFGGSPYQIQGDITIPNLEILTIEPGVMVEFQGHYKLNVQGRLFAIGTENDTITFTINDTTGFHNPEIPDGGWAGIRFINVFSLIDSSSIIYCKIKYGKAVGYWPDNSGGAICVDGFDNLTISNCLITNNIAGGFDRPGGGGIALWNSNPEIRGNTISNNVAQWGGGIQCYESSPSLDDVTFSNNTAVFWGGGINASNCNLQIDNCSFVENNAPNGVGGAICFSADTTYSGLPYQVTINRTSFSENTAGGTGGVRIDNWAWTPLIIDVTIDSCEFINNSSYNCSGLLILDCTFTLSNSVFAGNTAVEFAAAAAFSNGCVATVSNCLFASNIASTGGGNWGAGGVSVGANVDFMNCTFADNLAYSGAGLQVGGGGIATTTNCIFWGNSTDQIALETWNNVGGTLTVNYCDVQGGEDSVNVIDPSLSTLNWGDGNIDEDPDFENPGGGDYHLQNSSPCIGAAIDTIEINGVMCFCPPFDIEGKPRPNPQGSMPDIGAYESALADPVGVNNNLSHIPNRYSLAQNYPNPFNPLTKIKYSIPQTSNAIIKVFDILGSEIETLVNEEKPASTYEITWNVDILPSGVYFYQLRAGNFIQTKKMILLK